MLGPYIDTLLICTLTGLVIITTGVFDKKMTEVRSFDHSTFDIYSVPVDYNDEWMNRDIKQYNKDRETEFSMPEFDGKLTVAYGRVFEVEFSEPPFYPPELTTDTLYALALVRNHGFVDDYKILKDGVPFSGVIEITPSGSTNGESIAILEGGEGVLQLEGGIYQNGSPLTAWGFKTGLSFLGPWGNYIITIAVFLFALSTMISWSYYGDRSIQYLIGNKAVVPYKYVYCIVLFIGAVSSLEGIWGFGDVALGVMAIPNLIAILFLSGKLRTITKEYFSKKHVPYKKRQNLS
jgi:AGCS family alanine or glycine:cation symporter